MPIISLNIPIKFSTLVILTISTLLIAEVLSHLSSYFYFNREMAIYHKLNAITNILYIIFLILAIVTLFFYFFTLK